MSPLLEPIGPPCYNVHWVQSNMHAAVPNGVAIVRQPILCQETALVAKTAVHGQQLKGGYSLQKAARRVREGSCNSCDGHEWHNNEHMTNNKQITNYK